MYSLLESNIDVEQFMTTIYRYIQLGLYVRARYDKERGFMRELAEVTEFYVTEDNKPEYHVIYHKNVDGTEVNEEPSKYLIEYLANQGVDLKDDSTIQDELPSLDKIEEQLKEKEERAQEKIEKKKEEAYYANFGDENYVEPEETVKDTSGPVIDINNVSTNIASDVKIEEEKKEEIVDTPTSNVEISDDDINSFVALMQNNRVVQEEKQGAPKEDSVDDNMYNYDYSQVEGKKEEEQKVDLKGAIPDVTKIDKNEPETEKAPSINPINNVSLINDLPKNPLDLEKTQYLDPVNSNNGTV